MIFRRGAMWLWRIVHGLTSQTGSISQCPATPNSIAKAGVPLHTHE